MSTGKAARQREKEIRMEKFVYQMPTKIVFGRGAELQTADCVQ